MRRLAALFLATAALAAPARRSLDLTLRIDAPRAVAAGFLPPFQVTLKVAAENPPGNGLVTFQGQCPWPDPGRALTWRWPGALVLDPYVPPRARTVKGALYTVRDARGRTVAVHLGKDAVRRVHAETLAGLVLHLTIGTLGEAGAAVADQLELEF